MIRLLEPVLPTAEQLMPYLTQIDRSRGRYTNGGPLVARLEAKVGELTGAPYCVAVSSGTLGLELALQAACGSGRRILMPAFTFHATATAALRTGHTIVLSDVQPGTWQLTPDIARALQGQYDAVVPVAAMGRPVEVVPWQTDLLERVPVIVDAAAALCSQRVTPSIDAAVFSLHATKPIAAAEGGIVATHYQGLADEVRSMACFGGRLPSATNAKLSEYHAAIALTMLESTAYISMLRQRHELRDAYREGLQRISGLSLQRWPDDAVASTMPVLLPREAGEIQQALSDRGIETRRWYYPALDSLLGGGHLSVSYPVTRVLSRYLLGLPFHLRMGLSDVRTVLNILQEVLS